ncbi:MAG: hypothetical protein H0W42_02775 [Gemmatimonadaceae bacterium]|nr:hypothetical protein [Gemmatimonadaceae bacterium]
MLAVVTIAVMAVLATVIFASLRTGGVDRIILAADILFRFKTEIIGTDPSFYERLKVYPGRLSHLVYPITTAQRNSCGQFYKASPDVNNWGGPYHPVPWVPGAPYVLALGIAAQDSTIRTNFSPPGNALALAIVMNDVQLADAQALKARIDGIGGDTIAFTQNGDNPVVVHYRIPITSLC